MDERSVLPEEESIGDGRASTRKPWSRLAEALLLRDAIAAAHTGDGADALRELRSRRVFALALAGVIVGLGAKQAARAAWPPIDLAAGKPWRTSSTYAGFDPAHHRVDGIPTDIVLHTKKEPNPWVEIDLQAPVTVSFIMVRNRLDYGADRAIPMAVQVSTDGAAWREVVRTGQVFHTWTPRFNPVQARFVRLQVLKTTFLHLERVAVQ
jgi:hypothetical protein